MSERKTDNGTPGRDTSRPSGQDRPERDHEGDKDEFEAGTSYQPSTNQARDEPLPASHHDDGRQETADDGRQQAARRSEPGRDNPRLRGQDHEAE
jgi:hypothetical protein